MDISTLTRKEVGALGERVAGEYAERHGMRVLGMNIARKTGEIDVLAQEGDVLHFIEVKTILVEEFPRGEAARDDYDPSLNLHELKIKKVARTAEWYVANVNWEGEWQVDGCLVWLRRRDGTARVQYLPQIV